MIRPTGQVSIHQSLGEAALCVGHEVLMEVNDNSALFVGDLRGILGQHLRPTTRHLFLVLSLLLIT